MAHSDEIIVGLDIGTTKIAVIVGQKDEHGKLKILGIGKAPSTGVTRGEVSHITPTIDAIKAAIEEAEAAAGVKIAEVNVGIAGQHIRSLQQRGTKTRKNQDDLITQNDISDIIADLHRLNVMPGERVIHVLPQEYTVDNEHNIKDPIGMTGARLEANCHVITGKIIAAQNIIRCVQGANLEVAELTLEPLASAEAVLSREEKEAGVVLVDIGGGTTDVAIFQDEIIRHTAVIPFGGNIITDDIKTGCNIIKRQAELLKVKFGSALASENLENNIVTIPGLRDRPAREIQLKNLAHIIQSRMEEIIDQVYYEIKNSGFDRDLVAGIVVTGGGSQLRHIAQLFEFHTGIETRVGFPNEHLGNGNEDLTNPLFSTGVGLVLKGFEALEKKKLTAPSTPDEQKPKQTTENTSILEKLLKRSRDWFETDIQ